MTVAYRVYKLKSGFGAVDTRCIRSIVALHLIVQCFVII